MHSPLRLVAFVLAGAALALPAPAWTQAQSLDAQIEPVRVKYGIPALAAAVVKKGEIVAAGAVGVRVYGTNIGVTIDDRFHLGSDTKAMTATLAGILVDGGKLRWTSTIGEVLGADVPGMNQKLATVTLEQLLSHSSGIPSDTKDMAAAYFNTDAFDYNLAALRLRALAAWRHNEPKEPQGSPFQYANFGYIIAGAMIEKAAGVPWEQLIVEKIFAPLGLRTAGLGAQATPGKLDAPVGHQIDEQGKITPMLWGAAADAPPMLGPAGTAHMSILDFARWALELGPRPARPGHRDLPDAQTHPCAARQDAAHREPQTRHAADRRIRVRLGRGEIRLDGKAGAQPQRLECLEFGEDFGRRRQRSWHRGHDQFSRAEG
ncbi:MAG: serine hydrolase domain-containing protein [Xanthobacteraceae bacterium]